MNKFTVTGLRLSQLSDRELQIIYDEGDPIQINLVAGLMHSRIQIVETDDDIELHIWSSNNFWKNEPDAKISLWNYEKKS